MFPLKSAVNLVWPLTQILIHNQPMQIIDFFITFLIIAHPSLHSLIQALCPDFLLAYHKCMILWLLLRQGCRIFVEHSEDAMLSGAAKMLLLKKMSCSTQKYCCQPKKLYRRMMPQMVRISPKTKVIILVIFLNLIMFIIFCLSRIQFCSVKQ
jgi:hypothetical protein